MPTALRTSLHDRHAAAGAKLGAFAGWDMPLVYTTVRGRAPRGPRALGRVRRLAHGPARGVGPRLARVPAVLADQRPGPPRPGAGPVHAAAPGGRRDHRRPHRLRPAGPLPARGQRRQHGGLPRVAGRPRAGRRRGGRPLGRGGHAGRAGAGVDRGPRPAPGQPRRAGPRLLRDHRGRAGRRAEPGGAHRLHRRARRRDHGPLVRGAAPVGRAAGRPAPAGPGRPGGPRHAAPGDGLPAVRAGPLAGAHADRGRPALGLRPGGRRLHRRRDPAPPGRGGHGRAARHLHA